jgi:hypothetical protein
MITVSYHAQEQMKRLSARQKADLERLLSDESSLERNARRDMSERFVSKLGADTRVVWKKSETGDILILTVISHLEQ